MEDRARKLPRGANLSLTDKISQALNVSQALTLTTVVRLPRAAGLGGGGCARLDFDDLHLAPGAQ